MTWALYARPEQSVIAIGCCRADPFRGRLEEISISPDAVRSAAHDLQERWNQAIQSR